MEFTGISIISHCIVYKIFIFVYVFFLEKDRIYIEFTLWTNNKFKMLYY